MKQIQYCVPEMIVTESLLRQDVLIGSFGEEGEAGKIMNEDNEHTYVF